jgi:hypothetical protein
MVSLPKNYTLELLLNHMEILIEHAIEPVAVPEKDSLAGLSTNNIAGQVRPEFVIEKTQNVGRVAAERCIELKPLVITELDFHIEPQDQ